MSVSEGRTPNRFALFSAAGKGALIGIALSLIWPVIRLITRQEAPLISIFLLHFVLLGVTGATATAFYISTNGVRRRPAIFSGILAGLLVGLIAGFLNTLVNPGLGGTGSFVVAIFILPMAFLGPLAGGLGAWGTSLLPSTMFFQAETPDLDTRLSEKGGSALEPAETRESSIEEEPAPSSMLSEADALLDATDDLRSEVQRNPSFVTEDIISTPWDDNKTLEQEDSFKPPWEIEGSEESFQEETEEKDLPQDEAYTPAWATSLRSGPNPETTPEEPAGDESPLASRLAGLASAEKDSPLEEEADDSVPKDEAIPDSQPKTRLQEAVQIYESGGKEEAQRLLAQIVRNEEPENALAWLWLAATLDNDLTKKRFCVQRAMTIDPGNQAAQELAANIEATILPPKP